MYDVVMFVQSITFSVQLLRCRPRLPMPLMVSCMAVSVGIVPCPVDKPCQIPSLDYDKKRFFGSQKDPDLTPHVLIDPMFQVRGGIAASS